MNYYTHQSLTDYYLGLLRQFPVYCIINPFDGDDAEAHEHLMQRLDRQKL